MGEGNSPRGIGAISGDAQTIPPTERTSVFFHVVRSRFVKGWCDTLCPSEGVT